MRNLPKRYFRDVPAHVMEEIVEGMVAGRTEPSPEEVEEWLAFELEREAEALLAQA